MLSFVVVYIELVLFVFWEGLVVKKNHYAAHFGSQTCNTLASTGITEVNTCLAKIDFISSHTACPYWIKEWGVLSVRCLPFLSNRWFFTQAVQTVWSYSIGEEETVHSYQASLLILTEPQVLMWIKKSIVTGTWQEVIQNLLAFSQPFAIRLWRLHLIWEKIWCHCRSDEGGWVGF